jgi:hypothetical protein
VSYRCIDPKTFAIEGGDCHITRRGSAKLTGRPGEGYDGSLFLSAYDIAQLLRLCAGSDGEALRILSHTMLNGHRFDSYQCPIAPDNAVLEPF